MGFKLGPGSGARASARAPWRRALALALGAIAVGWLFATGVIRPGGGRAAEPEIDPRPVILSLQQLGELHTVKMTMKDVLRTSSDKDAEGWLHSVPGGDAAAHWATHNDALVVAEGTVEAGIDLAQLTSADVSKGRLSDGRQGLRVRLPQPTVYAPAVTLHVESTRGGLLWKDENLIPKAEAEAARRFADAAEKDNIRQHARENAIQRLRQMQQTVGGGAVEFYF